MSPLFIIISWIDSIKPSLQFSHLSFCSLRIIPFQICLIWCKNKIPFLRYKCSLHCNIYLPKLLHKTNFIKVYEIISNKTEKKIVHVMPWCDSKNNLHVLAIHCDNTDYNFWEFAITIGLSSCFLWILSGITS